jgi:hypothetical protein
LYIGSRSEVTTVFSALPAITLQSLNAMYHVLLGASNAVRALYVLEYAFYDGFESHSLRQQGFTAEKYRGGLLQNTRTCPCRNSCFTKRTSESGLLGVDEVTVTAFVHSTHIRSPVHGGQKAKCNAIRSRGFSHSELTFIAILKAIS